MLEGKFGAILCMRRFLIWITLSLLPFAIFGQSEYYNFLKLTTHDGLSHNQVNAILKDADGFMWFGTMSGLNRYDGYSFKIFRHNSGDSSSLNDNDVISLHELPADKMWVQTVGGPCIYDVESEKFNADYNSYLHSLGLPMGQVSNIVKGSEGRYWFIYGSQDIYLYSGISKTAKHFHLFQKSGPDAGIASVKESESGKLWVVYKNGFLQEYDAQSDKLVFTSASLQKISKSSNIPYSLMTDNDGDIWIWGYGYGAYLFHPQNGSIRKFDESTLVSRLRSNLVDQIVQDDSGLIWVGTDGGGVTLINKRDNFKTTYLLNDPEDPKSLSQNTIVTIYKDNSGILWLGTYKQGVNYINGDAVQFALYHHQKSNANSLPFNDVNKFAEDKLGNLWIGTNGGGLIYFDRKKHTFKQYLHNPKDKNSLSSNVIVALCIDHEGVLWVGTFYGGMNRFDEGKFIHYVHDPRDTSSIANDSVWDIFEDSENNLWVGTLGSGLDLFNRAEQRFEHFQYKFGTSAVTPSNFISKIIQDKKGNLWIGSTDGIVVFNEKKNTWVHYQHTNDKNSLSNNNVITFLADSKGRIWVGTREGLDLYHARTGSFQTFTMADGLPDNMILDILEDKRQTIWISTPNGLCDAIPRQNNDGTHLSIINYDETNNLQDQEFNDKAALKTKEGNLIFGGPSGFNIIDPSAIKKPAYQPEIALTGLQILNKNIAPGELVDGHVPLQRSLSHLPGIDLKYEENVFSIAFASLDYAHGYRDKYAYKLDGFNPEWLYANSNQRTATYTNLDPGRYTFNVKVLNSEGLWSNTKKLQIIIEPPFWRTNFAYLVYILVAISLLLLIRRITLDRIHMRYEVAQQRREVERAHTLERLKTKFFTNVSHEFRTPLSLIITPLDKVINQSTDECQKKQLHLIQRNAKRLLNLVNQLLDFRKMEVQELKLHSRSGDVIKFIKTVSLSFMDMAEDKSIGFVFDSEADSFITSFDHDKIERILFNLISNAFKFTPSGGRISVLLNIAEDALNADFRLLEINVIDTGIGIPKEKHAEIFERFYQDDVPESLINQGSGIGLAITREFVKMHNGEITVESEPGRGSCFKVILSLPVLQSLTAEPALDEIIDDEGQNFIAAEIKDRPVNPSDAGKNKKPVVLLVEDNEDLRFYLKDNLKNIYVITEASNGREGWQKALSQHPDIMVSDISMPEMNGIDLCRKIKSDKRTSHIPVILLTALTGEEEQLKGLEIGANDYMTKPFNFVILQSKIKNLLSLQETFKRTYKKQIDVQLPDVAVESGDEKFLRSAVDYIERNIANPDLSVEELSRQMNMSRVSLYKKLLLLTGKSPVEFIRSIRLKKAAGLMANSQMTISQISYEVGFNTPKYFAKSFREEYNMLPSAYISAIQKNKPMGEVAGKLES